MIIIRRPNVMRSFLTLKSINVLIISILPSGLTPSKKNKPKDMIFIHCTKKWWNLGKNILMSFIWIC